MGFFFSDLWKENPNSNLEFKQERKNPTNRAVEKAVVIFIMCLVLFICLLSSCMKEPLRERLIGWYSHFTEEEVEAQGLATKGGAGL